MVVHSFFSSHRLNLSARLLQFVQIVLSLALITPMVLIALTALGGDGEVMRHLISTVLLRYIGNTTMLMGGVGAVALIFGVSTAWLVSRYDFPYRRAIEWMLVLPLAIPPYIVAYAYTGFLDYGGPVQSGMRWIFSWDSAQDYFFPPIRSMGGAWLIMGVALYPYIYVITRAGFHLIPTRFFEAAILTGRNPLTTVALPMGRSAIIVGLALVLMEVVADLGTVEYFAIDTISLGVFNAWQGLNDLAAAAQLALVAFMLIAVLLGCEHYARSRRGFSHSTRGQTGVPRRIAKGWYLWGLPILCLVPVLIGFIVPVMILVGYAQGVRGDFADVPLIAIAGNTLLIATAATAVIIITALVIGIIAYYLPSRLTRGLAAVSAMGYAFPGTILAIGVLVAVNGADHLWRRVGLALGSDEWGGILAETSLMLIIAYAVRFQAMGYGPVRAGLERIPATLMPASRVHGYGFIKSIHYVVLPLLRPQVFAAMLLVFVEIIKELPMTLLLRPFNFDTLATITYQFANEEMIEQAALPALMIIAAGILPVIVINASMVRRSV